MLGVPAVPPASATSALNRVRAVLGRVHRSLAPPPVQILEALFGALDHASLVALCRLGVPAALEQPSSVAALAERLGVVRPELERVLRYGVARGWLSIDRRGRVRASRVTRFLHPDHPGGWAGWVDFAGGDEVTAALGRLTDGLRAGSDSFELANGSPFFAWMADHPERRQAFQAAMRAGAQMHGLVLASSLDWSVRSRVCDVGGGDGSLLRALLAEHPHLSATLFDLPEVVDDVDGDDRLAVVGGDAFGHVPTGFDSYLLVNVVHDWDDDAASKLLAGVAAAAPPGAQVVVVEGRRTDRPADDLSARTDLLMLAVAPGGRERSEPEMVALGRSAGLELEDRTLLASGDVAYRFVPQRRRDSTWSTTSRPHCD